MKETKTIVIIAVCLGAFFLALLSRFYISGGFRSIGGLGGVAMTAMGIVREKFMMEKEPGAPVNSDGMQGVYSGIDISNGGSWSESSAPVSAKGYEAADDTELFAYQNSTFTPECCTTSNTSISSDSGCLCASKEEERRMGNRGGNRKAN
jgi:hypothetical protein